VVASRRERNFVRREICTVALVGLLILTAGTAALAGHANSPSSAVQQPLPTDLQPAPDNTVTPWTSAWSIQYWGIWGPLPDGGLFAQTENLQVLYSPSLDAYFLADQGVDYSQLSLAQDTPALGSRPQRMGMFSPMDESQGGTSFMSFDTNGLWLEITNVADDCSLLNLHNATNQVYAIWSATNLSSAWQVEVEVWPTNGTTIPTVTPFTVQNGGRQTLALFAEDWTGVTENGNTTPDWWFWEYFGTTELSDTNLDSTDNTLLYDYTNGIDPNVIAFTLSATNFYVNQTNVPVQIEVSAGIPSFYAVLVNDTNTALAKWLPYTGANLTVSLGSTQGTYLV
jgi:hypothetical protein